MTMEVNNKPKCVVHVDTEGNASIVVSNLTHKQTEDIYQVIDKELTNDEQDKMYLFSIKVYADLDAVYRLVYAKNEDQARRKCIKSLPYQPHVRDIRSEDLFLATIF